MIRNHRSGGPLRAFCIRYMQGVARGCRRVVVGIEALLFLLAAWSFTLLAAFSFVCENCSMESAESAIVIQDQDGQPISLGMLQRGFDGLDEDGTSAPNLFQLRAALRAFIAALEMTNMEPVLQKGASQRQEAWAAGFKVAAHNFRKAAGVIE